MTNMQTSRTTLILKVQNPGISESHPQFKHWTEVSIQLHEGLRIDNNVLVL